MKLLSPTSWCCWQAHSGVRRHGESNEVEEIMELCVWRVVWSTPLSHHHEFFTSGFFFIGFRVVEIFKFGTRKTLLKIQKKEVTNHCILLNIQNELGFFAEYTSHLKFTSLLESKSKSKKEKYFNSLIKRICSFGKTSSNLKAHAGVPLGPYLKIRWLSIDIL